MIRTHFALQYQCENVHRLVELESISICSSIERRRKRERERKWRSDRGSNESINSINYVEIERVEWLDPLVEWELRDEENPSLFNVSDLSRFNVINYLLWSWFVMIVLKDQKKNDHERCSFHCAQYFSLFYHIAAFRRWTHVTERVPDTVLNGLHRWGKEFSLIVSIFRQKDRTWKFETKSNSKDKAPLLSGISWWRPLNLFSSCFLNIKISVVEEFLNKRSENSKG